MCRAACHWSYTETNLCLYLTGKQMLARGEFQPVSLQGAETVQKHYIIALGCSQL